VLTLDLVDSPPHSFELLRDTDIYYANCEIEQESHRLVTEEQVHGSLLLRRKTITSLTKCLPPPNLHLALRI
jgi:hypothetical protein